MVLVFFGKDLLSITAYWLSLGSFLRFMQVIPRTQVVLL